MSDDTAEPPTEQSATGKSKPPEQPGTDTPVGDMTEQGENEVGPHPSLTNIENVGRADLEADADGEAEETPRQDD